MEKTNQIKKYTLRHRRLKVSEKHAPLYNSPLCDPETVAKIAGLVLKGEEQEVMLSIGLDIRLHMLGYFEAARGGVDLCYVHPREIFRVPLMIGASSIILVHNHPSGDPKPSEEDFNLTDNVVEAGKLLKIPLIDHIIVAGDSEEFYSMQVHGKLGS